MNKKTLTPQKRKDLEDYILKNLAEGKYSYSIIKSVIEKLYSDYDVIEIIVNECYFDDIAEKINNANSLGQKFNFIIMDEIINYALNFNIDFYSKLLNIFGILSIKLNIKYSLDFNQEASIISNKINCESYTVKMFLINYIKSDTCEELNKAIDNKDIATVNLLTKDLLFKLSILKKE